MRLAIVAIPLILACNSSGSVDVDENSDDDCVNFFGDNCDDTSGPDGGTDGTDGSVVGEEDPGSGPGVDMWRVEVEAKGKRVADGGGAFHFETDLTVDLEDDQGQPATGKSVWIETALLGDRELLEDPGRPGRYESDMLGYARTYTLVVEPESTLERFETTAVGPGTHSISVPGSSLDISDDQTITWAPSGASFARIDSKGGGNQNIDDTGAFTIEAVQLDYELGCVGEEDIEVRRWEVLDVTNAVSVSTFEVSIEVKEEEIDTNDSRTADLEGEVQLDGDFDGMTGDVYVLLWPEKLDPDDVPFWHWTRIDDADFVDRGDYFFADLAPGDWYAIAYLDTDGSDAGLVSPDGPSQDEPFEERDFSIDPGVDETRDFDMQDQW
jgi:hypothetical protein